MIGQELLTEIKARFQAYKQLAERAIGRLSDDEFFVVIDAEANSVAIIVKHIAGNQISRWTDFLTSDGEKSNRNRDGKFIINAESRAELMDYWEQSWDVLFSSFSVVTTADLLRTIKIRGESHTVLQALTRQITHCAYHVGQIVLLSKHHKSKNWQTLSIARGDSEAYLQIKLRENAE
ncbi:MAG: DUF1572 family protein [Pyrinomonadaceae bacterium]